MDAVLYPEWKCFGCGGNLRSEDAPISREIDVPRFFIDDVPTSPANENPIKWFHRPCYRAKLKATAIDAQAT